MTIFVFQSLGSKMKLFVLGFMGNGKTTVGRRLADRLHYAFVDLDDEIANEEGLTIEEIFFQHSEQYFRQKEHEHLLKVCQTDNVVIAVGGGTPCFFDNMAIMNREGITIYLKLSEEHILQRILAMPNEAIQARPLIANKSEEELKSFIHEVLQKREPFYNQAKIIVDNHQPHVDQTVELIVSQIPLLK
ncbi:MAG: shikimate kinase [Bacteroidales bacterium]